MIDVMMIRTGNGGRPANPGSKRVASIDTSGQADSNSDLVSSVGKHADIIQTIDSWLEELRPNPAILGPKPEHWVACGRYTKCCGEREDSAEALAQSIARLSSCADSSQT
jgi:hypothetical protein